MRLVFGLLLVVCPLAAQLCPEARILPAGLVTGSLDDSSCWLSDFTVYAAYRLDLPVRGNFQADLASGSDFVLILRNGAGQMLYSGRGIHQPLEAGSYTLLVDGSTPGQVGGYSVQTAFTPERGMWCGAFPSLGLNQTAAGRLGASGCALPDGTLYEAHTLHTFGSGTLTVSVNSSDFPPTLMVRDDSGRLVASGDVQASLPVDSDSDYVVVVGTHDQTGSYELTTAFDPAADETCRAMKALSDDGSDSDTSSVSGDSCSTTLPASGNLLYFNYYTFRVSAAGVAGLAVSSSDFVPMLRLLDGSGNLLASGETELRVPVAPGDYAIQVFSPLASGGAYQLTYQLSAVSPQACPVRAANPGDSIAGTLSASSCRNSAGVADIYSVTLPSPGTLQLSMNAGAFDPVVAIRDTKDNLLVSTPSALAADLPAGAYTVLAAGSGAGDYQLSTALTAHDIPPCDYIQPLDLNGGYIQKLRPGSCRDTDGQYVDLYQFTLPSDSVVLSVMTSSQIDGFLRLTDEAGNVLRSDDNSYGLNAPLIVQYLPAGTYRLAARAVSATAGGYYEVDLRTTPGPRPPFCAPTGKLAAGATVTATLSYTSCQYTGGTFADLYEITLPSPATIDVRVNSSDFTPALVVLDAKGNVVDEDDTDAELVLPLPTGKYYAVAKPVSDYYHIGAYTISMSQQ
jgi:hypothetical protein